MRSLSGALAAVLAVSALLAFPVVRAPAAQAGDGAATESGFLGTIGDTVKESRPYTPPPPHAKVGAPNVVFIVLDDTGFSDLGSFGSEIATPNLDTLAAHGLRYNNFHTKAVCSPSRAALLTGRNSHTVGMGNLSNVINGFPNRRGEITHAAATVAELLQSVGYNTYAVGKWHLISPYEGSAAGPIDQWPVQRGFDRFYGFLGGWSDQFHPDLVQDNTPVDTPDVPGYHLSADLVDHGIEYIRDQTNAAPDKPFFLYLAFGATHAPHQAPTNLIEKYVPIFSKGWDRTRADRLARQKQMGLVPADTVLTPRNPGVAPWDSLSADEQAVFTRYQAAYAGFLEDADIQVGRLLQALKALGRLDDTMIVVISDNGASREGDADGTPNEWRDITNLNHDREPIAEQMARINDIGTDKTFGNYPMGWAMAGNTPFKYYKSSVWGGGERDPLIVFWPKGIKQGGAIRKQFVDIIDITPTVLDLAGVTPPTSYHGVAQLPIAGRSFAATFANPDAPDPRDTQYFEIWGQRAIWHHGWKAVSVHSPGEDYGRDRWELYDLAKDFSEAHDVAARYPEKLAGLEKLWWAEARRYGVLPLDDRTVTDPSFSTGQEDPRSQYVFYPGRYHLEAGSDPDIVDRSFSIAASVTRANNRVEGVLLAAGDRFGGYAMYIKDGKLVFDDNDFGRHIILRSQSEVPLGDSVVKYIFSRSAKFTGTGRLYINGGEVASAEVRTTPTFSITWNGISVGRDSLSPVSDGYAGHGDFAFPTDALHKVVVTLAPK